MQPIPRTPALIRYSRITGARFFADGNAWCATFPDFVNQVESPIGFGDTQMDALVNLLMEAIERLRANQKEPDPIKFNPATEEILNAMKKGDL
jgi:hypothetical protein